MSYDIVRSVKIKDGIVTLKSASNNVWPRDAHEWQMDYRNEHNPFTGQLAAEVEVFAGYEQGNFQGGSNKFTKQLEVLRHLPEYAAFDWRGNWEGTRDTRENKQAYYQLLATALKTPAPQPRFAITKLAYGSNQTAYFKQRKGAGFCRWYLTAKDASLFRYAEDAANTIKHFTNSDSWEVVEVA